MRLGAYAWTAAEREAYANDLGDQRALIAVSAPSNRSKADQDPVTWLPPAVGYRCTYVTDWLADKTRCGLTIDAAEHDALAGELSQCPNTPITMTLAEPAASLEQPERRQQGYSSANPLATNIIRDSNVHICSVAFDQGIAKVAGWSVVGLGPPAPSRMPSRFMFHQHSTPHPLSGVISP